MGFGDGGGSRDAILIVNISLNVAQGLEVSCAMDFYLTKDVSITQRYHRYCANRYQLGQIWNCDELGAQVRRIGGVQGFVKICSTFVHLFTPNKCQIHTTYARCSRWLGYELLIYTLWHIRCNLVKHLWRHKHIIQNSISRLICLVKTFWVNKFQLLKLFASITFKSMMLNVKHFVKVPSQGHNN